MKIGQNLWSYLLDNLQKYKCKAPPKEKILSDAEHKYTDICKQRATENDKLSVSNPSLVDLLVKSENAID